MWDSSGKHYPDRNIIHTVIVRGMYIIPVCFSTNFTYFIRGYPRNLSSDWKKIRCLTCIYVYIYATLTNAAHRTPKPNSIEHRPPDMVLRNQLVSAMPLPDEYQRAETHPRFLVEKCTIRESSMTSFTEPPIFVCQSHNKTFSPILDTGLAVDGTDSSRDQRVG